MLHLGAHASVNEAIKLYPCEIIDVSSLEGSADYQAIANNPELLAGLDELVHAWCKQIEQVIYYNNNNNNNNLYLHLFLL